MAFRFRNHEDKWYQVVDAAKRGDQCYENRRGFYWHLLDADWGINTSTINGPFATYLEADANANGLLTPPVV